MATSRADRAIAFRTFVDRAVADALRGGASSFAALLQALPSIYPTEALAALDRLGPVGLIDADVLVRLRGQAAARPFERPEGQSLLPLPHPLDFEWRFTRDASRDLLNAASALTRPHADVLLFGTPGVAVEAICFPTNRHLAFLGEDNVVTRRLMVLNAATGAPLSIAFCNELPRESADAVLLDPPWYLDFIRPMLAAASKACRKGGVLLVSLPPVGTRASAAADREAVIRFAGRLGLELAEDRPLSIAYDTPFFEANALAAAGLFAPARWRRGDLVVFRRSLRSARPVPLVSGRRPTWIEASVGRMRISINSGAAPGDGLSGLLPLVSGDILPTVSRRDPRRRGAQVWTSGNRIFRTDNPKLVLEAALACGSEQFGAGIHGHLWGSLAGREAIERVGHELRELAALEAAEEGGSPPVTADWGGLWTSGSTSSCSRWPATLSG